ncbi:hypothetical protein SY1_09690 [Fretibacterium fastidiosum]|uniref:Uncharacterized protein n=1 Tax=Fretibacterium fastidiosum TaxID=651822 RepID=A0AB94IWS0_9BACT|nr:hypothetical protein SY1_09690 [Fretibacterium fastidiosum]
MPASLRCSATARAMARMWASLKLRSLEEPRWPDVPNATCWDRASGSGSRV